MREGDTADGESGRAPTTDARGAATAGQPAMEARTGIQGSLVLGAVRCRAGVGRQRGNAGGEYEAQMRRQGEHPCGSVGQS